MEYQKKIEALRREYGALKQPPADADAKWLRQRGRDIEQLLKSLLLLDDLEPKIDLRPSGEQIDGSFVLDGRTYLLEVKWQAGPVPASALYAFKGKVDGKLTGTIGIFIAINGFSDDAHDALRFGKELNIILFDGDDFRTTLEWGFTQALRKKLRAAAEIGLAYYSLEPLRISLRTRGLPTPGTISGSGGPRIYRFIVENRTDAIVVKILAARLLEQRGESDVIVQVAGGKLNIPVLANGPWLDSWQDSIHTSVEKLVVVADGDGSPDSVRELVEQQLDAPLPIIVADQHVSDWIMLGQPLDETTKLKLSLMSTRFPEGRLHKLAKQIDVEELLRQSASFRAFRDALLE